MVENVEFMYSVVLNIMNITIQCVLDYLRTRFSKLSVIII